MESIVTSLKVFLAFAKAGIFGFGGGPSIIPLIQEEVVDVNSWLTNEQFADALALGNSLPGPIATKMAAYVGYKVSGVGGAVAGVLGMVLPSMVAMLALATVYFAFKDNPKMSSVMKGVRPVVIALMAMVVYELFPASVNSPGTGAVAAVAFVVVVFLHVHPALAIVGGALFGYFIY
jgi:chromate transporter